MPSLASQLGSALEDWESQKFTDVDVTRFTGACDRQAGEDEYPILAARETPEPLSRAAFRHDAFEHELRFFAYVDGKFRYVGGLKPPESFDRKDGSAETDTSLASAMKVPGAIHSARLIKGDPPTYPTEANIQRFEGDVVLHAIITADGRVAELRVMKGRCMFAEAAVNAVRKWRYSPTMVAGKPVAVDTTIDVRFALSR
jgi:TonB family protein